MWRIFIVAFMIFLLSRIGAMKQDEVTPPPSETPKPTVQGSSGANQATGYLRSSMGKGVIEVVYQTHFYRDEDRRILLSNVTQLMNLLQGEYYGSPDGGLFSAMDMIENDRLSCSVAVSFTGFSYHCIREGFQVQKDEVTAEGVVEGIRSFLGTLHV